MNRKITITVVTGLILCSIIISRAILISLDKKKPNIVIITLDALRPDHLGCYGYTRDTSPHIDDFSKNTNLFLNCFSAGSWTIPANYSLITSLYLPQHNMNYWNSIFDNRIPTLFSRLRDQGYAQRFFSNSAFLVRSFKENFGQKMDLCAEFTDARLATEGALDWIKRQRPPFFIWVYYHEPHRPYMPPAPYNNLYKYREGIQLPIEKVGNDSEGGWDYIPDVVAERGIRDTNYYIAQYDGLIHYIDEEVGKLLSGLKKLGLFKKSLIVLTSDHGESLGEHHLYFNHNWTLFNEIIKIPLLIKMPGQRQGAKIKENVSLIDILPTLLSETRVKNCQNCEGISLSGPLDNNRGLFSFGRNRMYCFVYDNWKLIKYPFFLDEKTQYIKMFFPEYGSQHYQLFNIARDPMETLDLKNLDVSQFDEMFVRLTQGLKEMKPQVKSVQSFSLSEEEREKLHSLGYAQ